MLFNLKELIEEIQSQHLGLLVHFGGLHVFLQDAESRLITDDSR